MIEILYYLEDGLGIRDLWENNQPTGKKGTQKFFALHYLTSDEGNCEKICWNFWFGEQEHVNRNDHNNFILVSEIDIGCYKEFVRNNWVQSFY